MREPRRTHPVTHSSGRTRIEVTRFLEGIMAYHGSQQRVEGDPAEVLHRAGEVQQRELVVQIAASPAAFEILGPAYHEARTTRLRCLILDALQGKEDPRSLPLSEAGLADDSPCVRAH